MRSRRLREKARHPGRGAGLSCVQRSPHGRTRHAKKSAARTESRWAICKFFIILPVL
ncbi:hypothetical protein A176_003398 [Myxococcus hansupus]|uniref:Uncharacterized protein n=1 Tax=Pseudomyxococcus hansupus TaxID=1297742 RepID=A0A0H4WSQ7_9BACT|nr:hypothetical protein A176_003398 [Myxococcus hansupus]